MANSRTRREWIKATAAALAMASGPLGGVTAGSCPAPKGAIRWLAFYGEHADEAILENYDIVILDLGFRGSIGGIAAAGTRICGYLSLCEIRRSNPAFDELDRSVLLGQNPAWPETSRVDVRNPSWRSLVLDSEMPSIVAMGFNGVMFDTLDTAAYLEAADPSRYHGMRAAAIELVEAIRARWPGMMLIMNRGYDLLPDLAERIDALIVESLLTVPAPTGGFVLADPCEVNRQLSLLEPATKRRPPLPILSLDYWDPDDVEMITEIYRRERDLGHNPYVATRLLDRIVPEIR